MTKARQTDSYKDKKNGLEWSLAILGFLLVLSIIGYLVYKTITYTAGPAQLYVEYSPEPGLYEPNRYLVKVHNKGSETAEAIIIEVSLEKRGTPIEKAQLNIDYCPKESIREGYISFQENPQLADTVLARVVSYNKP
jgi:uncharacterized protein (TIGR02588 family)